MPELIDEAQFSVPTDATRTVIGDDGQSVYWEVGDRLALWAKNSSGEYVASGAQFMLRHFSTSYTKAFFAGTIAEQSDDVYTYYMCAPMPKTVSGTDVTYTLPAEQSGKYQSSYDIMVARALEAGAITTSKSVEFNTSFIHQMHALKITVPENRNLFKENGSSKFYELEISFPEGCAVVGDITFDVANPDATPTYSNTSNVIRVTNNEGFDVGSKIWVFVLPGSVDGDIDYYVRGVRRRSEFASNALSKQFERGHVTPINMRIPEVYPLYTAVHFSVDQNNLGEEFNKFDVYDANNNHMGTFERNASNKYSVDYEGEFDADQYDNTSWRIVFDSDHAIVETVVNLGDLSDYTEHPRGMNVPYLLSENFSTLANYTDEATTSAKSLDLPGWSAARSNCKDGVIQLAPFYAIIGRYQSRLDSAPISSIKENANIRISFDANNNISKKKDAPLQLGYGTAQGAIKSDTAVERLITTETVNKGESRRITYKIENFPKNGRLAWRTELQGAWGTYNYVGIDNIIVQIIP